MADSVPKRSQRVRDPIHNLIHFDHDKVEEAALWRALQTRPMQRLRRVKQLGFSDLVFPGATHSRLGHSLGAFHIAKQLVAIASRTEGTSSREPRAKAAIAAALLHDVGHGPFSHAFEEVAAYFGWKNAHHEAMSRALILDSEISKELEKVDVGFPQEVADMVTGEGKRTIYHSVVSSQFDADRLDYMQRDRLMAGTQQSSIDFTWLLANLEIGSVSLGVDDEEVGKVQTFVISPKALHAAEAYILALFQLYPTVYFHKTSRGAEKIFTRMMIRLVELAKDSSASRIGLHSGHPLMKFALQDEASTETHLDLDDAVVWGALPQLSCSSDKVLSHFASCLLHRKLYKCFDVREQVAARLMYNMEGEDLENAADKVALKVHDVISEDKEVASSVLLDQASRSPYKKRKQESGPLEQINVQWHDGKCVDIEIASPTLTKLRTFSTVRAYYDPADTAVLGTLISIVQKEVEDAR